MIHFVGAGPGATDLITIRGAKLLAEADVIVYAGSLVNDELLNNRKATCRIYNSATMTLEEVMEVMIEAEKAGLNSVRLHTGDPSIYGAIREQMDILAGHGLAYENVPGVSSFLAAASAVQAEYTLPGVSQTLILTRMEGRTPVPPLEDISSLASHQTSMVIFLSADRLKELSDKLIKGGYKPDTPAAIVYKASWNDEIKIKTNLSSLADKAKEKGINKTALVLVGNFLGSEYDRSELYNPKFSHEFRKASQ